MVLTLIAGWIFFLRNLGRYSQNFIFFVTYAQTQ